MNWELKQFDFSLEVSRFSFTPTNRFWYLETTDGVRYTNGSKPGSGRTIIWDNVRPATEICSRLNAGWVPGRWTKRASTTATSPKAVNVNHMLLGNPLPFAQWEKTKERWEPLSGNMETILAGVRAQAGRMFGTASTTGPPVINALMAGTSEVQARSTPHLAQLAGYPMTTAGASISGSGVAAVSKTGSSKRFLVTRAKKHKDYLLVRRLHTCNRNAWWWYGGCGCPPPEFKRRKGR